MPNPMDRNSTHEKTYAPKNRPIRYASFFTLRVKMRGQVPVPKSWYAAWPKIAATVNRPISAITLRFANTVYGPFA